jgi:hypothetical protein
MRSYENQVGGKIVPGVALFFFEAIEACLERCKLSLEVIESSGLRRRIGVSVWTNPRKRCFRGVQSRTAAPGRAPHCQGSVAALQARKPASGLPPADAMELR